MAVLLCLPPLTGVARGNPAGGDQHGHGFSHAIDLHGIHFCEALPGGAPGALRDTLLLIRVKRAGLMLLQNNPGDWLYHCHMLSHAGAGMMTWLKVTA